MLRSRLLAAELLEEDNAELIEIRKDARVDVYRCSGLHLRIFRSICSKKINKRCGFHFNRCPASQLSVFGHDHDRR